jgi:uncharacterized protein
MGTTIQLGEIRLDSELLAEICQRYGVYELAMFGSATRGEMGPESDLDLMVEFQPGTRIGLIRFESLAEELGSWQGGVWTW